MTLTTSIVVCSDGRASSLRNTLESLEQLNLSNFEVCVVAGPTPDGSREMLNAWRAPIKVAYVEQRNLAVSRNVGIELAAGDIVAFLDDDAIPEPEWLGELLSAYSGDLVGGAGGFVHDHTGVTYQYRFGTTDRLGRADLSWSRAAPELSFPFSTNFPHLLGANTSFRRSVLLSVGGFDEEYDYYLDETDLTARIVDGGWQIVQIAGAHVHHKFMSSTIRNETRVLKSWYSIIKNKIYYGLRNSDVHHSVDDVIGEVQNFVRTLQDQLDWTIQHKLIDSSYRAQFTKDVRAGWADGMRRGLSDGRRIMSRERCLKEPPPFLRYKQSEAVASGKAICLLSREYPPINVGGVGRYVHQLARGLASLGYQVHVLTGANAHSTVDLEEGVWVHRLSPVSESAASYVEGGEIPGHIWSYSSTMLSELKKIADRRDILCVYAPIWDCEGIAILRDARFPVIVGLQTTLRFWLDSHPDKFGDANFMRDFAKPMLALEKEVLARADALHSISHAIGRDIAESYRIDIAGKTTVVPLGLEDFSELKHVDPPALPPDVNVRILFVGRLELRKGIDVLLQAAPLIVERFPNCQFDIVGNDTLLGPQGRTFREEFEARPLAGAIRKRVVFHGEVSEERLRGFYKTCDVFVAPSRFESFGLIFVEAMMFAKPTVGCRIGGMPEVIAHGETGLLATPGSVESFTECVCSLLRSSELRRAYGVAGRQRYLARFNPVAVTNGVEALIRDVAGRWETIAGSKVHRHGAFQ